MSIIENGWTDNLPDDNGVYWWRLAPGLAPEVITLRDGFVYDFGDAEPTSVGFYQRGKWLGPLRPEDFQRLAALRKAAQLALKYIEADPVLDDDGLVVITALREARVPLKEISGGNVTTDGKPSK